MQIHQVEVGYKHEHTLDPENGRVVLKRTQYLAPSTTAAITYEDDEYRVQADGTFDVSDEAGAYYLKRDGWFEGPNPFADLFKAAAAENAEITAKEAESRKTEQATAKKAKAAETPAQD